MPRKKKAPPEPVGKKIKKARTAKKFSLDHVANETGFSIDYIKELEAGKRWKLTPGPCSRNRNPNCKAELKPKPSEQKTMPIRP
jgi:hypothetical protein